MKEMQRSKRNAYSTRDSQAVSNPSTSRAQRCLTWQIRRDAVFSTRYGRKRATHIRMSETFARFCALFRASALVILDV